MSARVRLSMPISLPPVRPMQPSQFHRGLLWDIGYRVQVLRDRWCEWKGEVSARCRCDHCWRVLKIFTPCRDLLWCEEPLKAPGWPLAKRTWTQCPMCHSRTSDGYRFRADSTSPWSSGRYGYSGVFRI